MSIVPQRRRLKSHEASNLRIQQYQNFGFFSCAVTTVGAVVGKAFCVMVGGVVGTVVAGVTGDAVGVATSPLTEGQGIIGKLIACDLGILVRIPPLGLYAPGNTKHPTDSL